jgi:hypothetical protein
VRTGGSCGEHSRAIIISSEEPCDQLCNRGQPTSASAVVYPTMGTHAASSGGRVNACTAGWRKLGSMAVLQLRNGEKVPGGARRVTLRMNMFTQPSVVWFDQQCTHEWLPTRRTRDMAWLLHCSRPCTTKVVALGIGQAKLSEVEATCSASSKSTSDSPFP